MRNVLLMIPLMMAGFAVAQMPSGFDASGQSVQASNGVSNDDPNAQGEVANPKLLGMEIPLMDPSNDTVKYNGAKLDVGNNAVVRARFEKFLAQSPDESGKAKMYRKRINELLALTRKYCKNRAAVGSETLKKIGMGLYDASEYPADYGQSGMLANAMVTVLDAQRSNQDRKRNNDDMDKATDELVKRNNMMVNRNSIEPPSNDGKGINASAKTGRRTSNTYLIAENTKRIAANEAHKVKNEAASAAALLEAKINYQGVLINLFAQRFYDHALIGARVYRHLFRDGDMTLKLDKESDASKMFVGIAGVPPSVAIIDSMATTARSDVERGVQTVMNLLMQNKMAEATQRLIEVVAVGEFMQCVSTFPQAERQRVAKFWNLRKQAFSALNSRDYAKLEGLADEMKAMDADFDDVQLRTYCSGKMQQSNLCLFNAQQAMEKGDMETFNREISNAGIIWPTNPKLRKGAEELDALSSHAPLRDEFRKLFEAGEYRRIAKEKDRFKPVAMDKELEPQYTKALTIVGTIDGVLKQMEAVVGQDRSMGPCAAYETMRDCIGQEDFYAADHAFVEKMQDYANAAHDFVDALKAAEESEARGEYGSALASYYRASCIYPKSRMAADGARRVEKIVAEAQF